MITAHSQKTHEIIKQKLSNKQGASMIFALCALMFVLMISTVILNAALTNRQRVANSKLQMQDYLTVESASKMLANKIDDLRIPYQIKTTTVTTSITTTDADGKSSTSTNTTTATVYETSDPSDTTRFHDIVEKTVCSWVNEHIGEDPSPSDPHIAQFSVTSQPEGVESNPMSVTTAELKMCENGEYSIKGTVSLTSEKGYENKMIFTAQGHDAEAGIDETHDTSDNESGNTVTETDTTVMTEKHEIYWDNVVITKGN